MTNIPLFKTVEALRKFFAINDFLETPTPPVVTHPGMETHLHPFKVESVYRPNSIQNLYLQTSPEFHMKKLLSEGLEKIYNLSYCFRDEPSSETHRFQFLMLEWYRANSYYHEILEDTLNLIEHTRIYLLENGIEVKESLNVEHYSVDDLFKEYVGLSILEYAHIDQRNELKDALNQLHPNLLPHHEDLWPWEDYFHMAFLNLIEPHFQQKDLVVVDEFPAPLAALSTLKKDDPRVCERFEIYISGIELCNCFNELTKIEEQRERMKEEALRKRELYQYELPEPNILYQALTKGIPPSAGIALGVERLLMGLLSPESETPSFYH